MKRMLFAALLAGLCGGVVAQPRIRTERLQNNSVEFILEDKTTPGTLTVFLTLKEVSNCNTPTGTSKYEVLFSGTRLLTLRPSDQSRGVGYNYSYRSFHGPVDRQADTAFVYRMPTTLLKPVRVARGVSVYDRLRKNDEEKEGALGLHFEMEKGDTVYAMRRGTVVKIHVAEKRDPNAPAVSFTSKSPSLTVEQPDGSFAWYVCLDRDNVLVVEGDEVLPGTPLALVGSYDGERYKFSVQTFWWETNPDAAEPERNPFVRRRFFPRFATEEGLVCVEKGTYRAVESEEMVIREMSKKELKKRYGGKKTK